MSRRIEGGLSTQLNPFGPQWPSTKSGEAAPVGQQVQQTLFGKSKPLVLDAAEYPELADLLEVLRKYVNKLARMAGDAEGDYIVTSLAELFERRGGEADAAEVSAIYARHGLGDAIGWEVDHPIASRGADFAWTLAPGADAEDAEGAVGTEGVEGVVGKNAWALAARSG